jgi:hypothetical protein
MATGSTTKAIPLTLYLTEQAKELLSRRAAACGTDLAGLISSLAEDAARAPFSIGVITTPDFQRSLQSGTTDDELADDHPIRQAS